MLKKMQKSTHKTYLKQHHKQKLSKVMLNLTPILIILGVILVAALDFTGSTLYAEVNKNTPGGLGVQDGNWRAMGFVIGYETAQGPAELTGVSLFVKPTAGVNNYSDWNFSIHAVDANNHPTGNPLSKNSTCNMTVWSKDDFTWQNISMPAMTLQNGTNYTIVVGSHFSNVVGGLMWGRNGTPLLNDHGKLLTSADDGTTWGDYSGGIYTGNFRVYGGGTAAGSGNVVLDSPIDNTVLSTIGTNFTANYSIDTDFNMTNATYYIWNSTGIFNNTVMEIVTGITNSTNKYIDELVFGNYDWNVYGCWANTTFSNCSFATSNYSFFVGASVETQEFLNYSYETQSQTFNATITLFKGTTLYDTQLYYNGTYYEATETLTGGENYTISSVIDIPIINGTTAASQLKDWHWRLIYPLGSGAFTYQNLTTYNQNVSEIKLFSDGCIGNNMTLNFSAHNEENASRLTDFDFYGTFEYWLGSGDSRKNISVTNTSIVDELTFCIYPNNLTYYSDAKIQYEKSGYVKRSNYLINSSLTNTTSNVRLYLLNSSISTSFIVNVIDEVQFPVPNAYVYIQRYYPGLGIFHTVETGKTDNSGNTIGHFEAETEDYKIIIFKDGVILFESEMQKVFCGETPCTLTYQISPAAPSTWIDIGVLPNLLWSLDYNEDTKIWTYTYVDTSGTTNYGRLYVYNEDGRNRNTICNKTDNAPAATIICNSTGYEGTIFAEVYISRSPEVLLWLESIMERAVKAIFGMEGLFWATIILLIIGLVGIWNPSIGIIMMIAGVIMINFLQIASLGTVTIMGISIIGVILLWEMKKP